jgi:hypothetical protein
LNERISVFTIPAARQSASAGVASLEDRFVAKGVPLTGWAHGPRRGCNDGTGFGLVNQPGCFSPGEYHALEATMRLDGQLGHRILDMIYPQYGPDQSDCPVLR